MLLSLSRSLPLSLSPSRALSLCLPLSPALSFYLPLFLSVLLSPTQANCSHLSVALSLCRPTPSQPASVPLSRAPASPPPPPAPPLVPALPRARLLPAAPAASVPAPAAASSPLDRHTREPAGAGRLRGLGPLPLGAAGVGRVRARAPAGCAPRAVPSIPPAVLRQPRGWRQSAGATRVSVSVINQRENWQAVPCPSTPPPRSPLPAPVPEPSGIPLPGAPPTSADTCPSPAHSLPPRLSLPANSAENIPQ